MINHLLHYLSHLLVIKISLPLWFWNLFLVYILDLCSLLHFIFYFSGFSVSGAWMGIISMWFALLIRGKTVNIIFFFLLIVGNFYLLEFINYRNYVWLIILTFPLSLINYFIFIIIWNSFRICPSHYMYSITEVSG